MFSHPGLAKKRRTRRRLKAAASIMVAVAAGTFLACQRAVTSLARAGGDASTAPDAGSPAPPPTASSRIEVRSLDGGLVADARTDALVVRPPRASHSAVDVKEHRKGMPVPDNLLE